MTKTLERKTFGKLSKGHGLFMTSVTENQDSPGVILINNCCIAFRFIPGKNENSLVPLLAQYISNSSITLIFNGISITHVIYITPALN